MAFFFFGEGTDVGAAAPEEKRKVKAKEDEMNLGGGTFKMGYY